MCNKQFTIEEGSGFDPSVFIADLGSTFIIIILLSFFWIATLISNLAIIVRRLRDAGYHWAFIFLYAAPILLMWVSILNILAVLAMLPCSIALIVLLCMPTKVQPMVYQGQFTTQQAQPQQQPVQAQQFTQPQEQAVEPETTPTQSQQESVQLKLQNKLFNQMRKSWTQLSLKIINTISIMHWGVF